MASSRVVLIGCIDFRINRRPNGRDCMGEFTAELGVDCFPVTRGGGVQDLIRPISDGFKDSMLRDIRVGVGGHGAEKVIAINHENCAAYAHFQFKTRKEEILRHRADLANARIIINNAFPEIAVELYFAELIPGKKDEFIIKPVVF